ncbi:hypothetical protein Tco_0904970 [Tanacetum coccineum]
MKIAINMDSSMGKMCLGKDVIKIFSNRNKGSGDWDSPEYKDTAGSGGKKEPKALVFHKITLKRKVIIKICLEYEVRKGKKLVKKDLMVLLCGEVYFVQFIINPEEDEFEPGLIFGRSFLRSANAIVNFEEGTITIQPDFDPFLLSSNEEGNPNLDNLEELLYFDFDEAPQTETDLPQLVCKIGKGSRNKKKIMENIMYFNNGVGPSSSVRTPLTQEEAKKRALAHNISMRYEMLEEVRPIKPEEEREMVKVKGQMLKEKKDPWAFIFPIRLEGLINENALADTGSDTNTMPYRIYEQLGRDDIMQEERNITMINYTEAEVTDRDAPIMVGRGFLDTIGGNIDIPNRILTTFDGLTRQTFRAARSEKIRIAESDSDDEEDYVIKRNDMGTPIHNSRPIGYQNNTNPAENITMSTLESVINQFRKISVWKKATSEAYDHEARSSRAKRSKNVETVEEALLPDVHYEFLEWSGCSREAKSRYNTRLATLLLKLIYSPQIVDWQLLHKIGCGEEIDNMLKISLKEVETNDELQSKKIISFRLGGHAHSLTLLEVARRLGLYHADELEEEGFDTYFQGGLRSDENFNAKEYWERISIDRDLHLTTGYEKIQKNDLWLLSMFEARHQNGYANVAWVIEKWIKRKGARSQKDSQICCGQFITKIARKSRVFTEEIVRTLSTPVYYRDLDRTTLRELIDFKDRLILDIPVDNVPRVAT